MYDSYLDGPNKVFGVFIGETKIWKKLICF